jgi:mRNA interferase MazF
MKKLMATSETIAQWDIVVVPFPYTDILAEKRRPAPVVSKSSMLKDHGLVWLAMITSAENEGWPSDIKINNLTKSGLSASSVIRPVKIATIESERVLKRIGGIGPKEKRTVKTALAKILD